MFRGIQHYTTPRPLPPDVAIERMIREQMLLNDLVPHLPVTHSAPNVDCEEVEKKEEEKKEE